MERKGGGKRKWEDVWAGVLLIDLLLDLHRGVCEIKLELDAVFLPAANFDANVGAGAHDYVSMTQLVSRIGSGQSDGLHACRLGSGDTGGCVFNHQTFARSKPEQRCAFQKRLRIGLAALYQLCGDRIFRKRQM